MFPFPMLSSAFTLLQLFSHNFSSTKAVGVGPQQIKNIVTFGDSYTDVVEVGDGGTAWPVYAAGYANVSLFPFARSGATCSNNITPRPFPSLFESQLPLYFDEVKNGTLELNPAETLYTLWIGTNDVGRNSLLTGGHGPNGPASIVDATRCHVNWIKVLYDNGARNFLFQNLLPLQLTPLYSPDSYPTELWNLQRNTTEWNLFMTELVLSGNELNRLLIEALVPKLPGAHIGIFDSHSLFADIYANPANYLNGTAPLNVTAAAFACVYELGTDNHTCTEVTGTDRDSYLWYDELHPSEQADRVVAKNIAEVIEGKQNAWTTWLS